MASIVYFCFFGHYPESRASGTRGGGAHWLAVLRRPQLAPVRVLCRGRGDHHKHTKDTALIVQLNHVLLAAVGEAELGPDRIPHHTSSSLTTSTYLATGPRPVPRRYSLISSARRSAPVSVLNRVASTLVALLPV